MGLYPSLWKYRTISNVCLGGQLFRIEQAYKESPWNDRGCPMGFEYYVDDHEVPLVVFDRALELVKIRGAEVASTVVLRRRANLNQKGG